MNNNFRLLYLSFALPPGLRAMHPDINPAGNSFEAQMMGELRGHFDFRSVGQLPLPVHGLSGPDATHDLFLVDQAPELWHRFISLRRLKQQYRQWQSSGWLPDAVLAYNLSPVYNQFIRWLRRQPERPKLVLLLLDSAQLGKPLSPAKRLRYRFKPFITPHDEMLDAFDACIGLSRGVERFSTARHQPFLWMPGGCTPARSIKCESSATGNGPVRFCYFGALASHAGVMEMTEAFLRTAGDSELHICGYGKLADSLAALSKSSQRLKFHGLLPTPEDCLRLGQACDVLVNARVPGYGNENNVPSKLFDYALCERAIIASKMSGVDEVLGPEAFYFDPANYDAGLRAALELAAATPREELRRRGARISERVKTEFNWSRQAARMAEFIRQA